MYARGGLLKGSMIGRGDGRGAMQPATANREKQKSPHEAGLWGSEFKAWRGQRACKLGDIGAGELGKLWRMMRQITWLNWPTIEPVL